MCVLFRVWPVDCDRPRGKLVPHSLARWAVLPNIRVQPRAERVGCNDLLGGPLIYESRLPERMFSTGSRTDRKTTGLRVPTRSVMIDASAVNNFSGRA